MENFIEIDEEFLEDDSRRMLKTAQAVLDMLKHPDFATLDYTSGVICLAKVFEREINLSVVHWIRQQKGIALPEHFDLFQRNLEKEDTEFENVDFNNSGSGYAWRAPMLGQSENACKKVKNLWNSEWKKMINNWNRQQQWQILLDNWKVITKKRNAGAHDPSVNKNVADAIKEALDDLVKEKVFDELFRMKKNYRGDGAVNIPDCKLRNVIAGNLGKQLGDPITRRDMTKLKEIDLDNQNISDLTGLEFAVNLNLDNNSITDLSPLSGLTNLISLSLNNNAIEDISPLKNLTKLENLRLNNNSISDLSPLKKLTKLSYLSLDNNDIEDISPLKRLIKPKNLKNLSLKNNPLNKTSKTHISYLRKEGVTVSY